MADWKKIADNVIRKSGCEPPKRIVVNKKAGPRQIEKELMLPFWNEKVRGVPNGFLRSALFGAVRAGRKKYLDGVKLHSVSGVDIIYTGLQLNQNDLDVWEQCINIAKNHKLDDIIEFNGNDFLRKIGRKTGGPQHKMLKDTFKRLIGCVVEFTDGDSYYLGSLLNDGGYDKNKNTYYIVVNKKIAVMYGVNGWTGIQLEERLRLKNQYLAKWLHGFYSTHRKPYKYKVETLYKICGSGAKELRFFKKDLKKALEKLSEITGWECSITSDNLVDVKK